MYPLYVSITFLTSCSHVPSPSRFAVGFWRWSVRGLTVADGGVDIVAGGLTVEEGGAVVTASSTSVDPLAVSATSECDTQLVATSSEKGMGAGERNAGIDCGG